MENEKRTLLVESKRGMKIYAVENVDLSQSPDHGAFDDPEADRRWRQIYNVATVLMGMNEGEAYIHACKTVFGRLEHV